MAQGIGMNACNHAGTDNSKSFFFFAHRPVLRTCFAKRLCVTAELGKQNRRNVSNSHYGGRTSRRQAKA
jgi:hypothetical protein